MKASGQIGQKNRAPERPQSMTSSAATTANLATRKTRPSRGAARPNGDSSRSALAPRQVRNQPGQLFTQTRRCSGGQPLAPLFGGEASLGHRGLKDLRHLIALGIGSANAGHPVERAHPCTTASISSAARDRISVNRLRAASSRARHPVR